MQFTLFLREIEGGRELRSGEGGDSVLDFKLNEALSGPGTKHWGVGFPKEFALWGIFSVI